MISAYAVGGARIHAEPVSLSATHCDDNIDSPMTNLKQITNYNKFLIKILVNVKWNDCNDLGTLLAKMSKLNPHHCELMAHN